MYAYSHTLREKAMQTQIETLSHVDETSQFSFETFKIKIISLSQSKLTVIKCIFFSSFIVSRSEIKEIRFHMLIITIITSFVLMIVSFLWQFWRGRKNENIVKEIINGTWHIYIVCNKSTMIEWENDTSWSSVNECK